MAEYQYSKLRSNRNIIIESSNDFDGMYGLFPFLNEYKNTKSHNHLKQHGFQCIETEKFFILFTAKSGSSLIMDMCKQNKLFTNPVDLADKSKKPYIDLVTYNNLINPIAEELIIKDVENLIKCLDGKSKKDLILVIRNPINKWMSGVMQDILSELNSSVSLSGWISEKYNINFINIPLFLSDKLIQDEEKIKICSDITFRYLKGIYNKLGTTCTAHSHLYNELFFLLLLNNPNINLNKLKIIDIDSNEGDLVELFKQYYPEIKVHGKSYNTHRPEWQFFFGGILSYFRQEHNNLLHSIQTDTSRDFYYYKKIQKEYSKNFYKGTII